MYEVIDLDHYGRGIIKDNGKVIFVNNSLVGEKVDIEIIRSYKNYSIANVINYREKSNDRIDVICPYYLKCGGCNIMHMNYESQLNFKKNKIKNIFKKFLNIDIDPNIVASDKEYNYRNKLVLHRDNKEYGLYDEKSNNIVNIDECKIVDDRINILINRCNSLDEVVFRVCDNEVISNILEKSESIKTIKGLKFNLNVNSFFQVNDYICSKLFDKVSNSINNDDIVLDLYAGVGTLSIVSSLKAKKVYSVEINKYASKNAKENIKLNNITNVEVINGDVSKIINNLNDNYNTIIVDPPRSGLDKNTISFINNSNSNKIIYVACDPFSLVRDIKLLDNYEIENVELFDMFPNTYHVETVCVLEKNRYGN